jgi:16S rRNA (cytosine967-C5)-methyltransferase
VGTGRPATSSADPRRRPQRRGPSARAVALRVIRRVTEEGAYSTLTLSRELERSGLSTRDRQLAAELTYGTLRARIPIDHRLAAVSTRPLEEIDPATLAILRLGAFQLLSTRVPAHAAVSESVALARLEARGFANAVLRAVARSPSEEQAESTGHDDAESIARITGLAPWAVAELGRVLPEDEVLPAARALASPAGLSLRVNRCRTTPEEVARALSSAGVAPEPGAWDQDVLRVPGGAPATLPGFDRGWFAVQDEASLLVVRAMDPRPGERILDACAGPGGKAAHASCLVRPNGVVVAGDVRVRRAALVRRAAARLGVDVRVVAQDARRPALPAEAFDAALVDAPCSGIGAARRRPELLWRPQRSNLAKLARLQVAILRSVVPLLRPGGRLVYSVCTFPRAETDAVLRAFAAACPEVEPMEVPGPDGSAPAHRLWPHRHGTDAMFFAGFRRHSIDQG